MSRIAIYADCSNLYHTVREVFQKMPNYKAYIKFIEDTIGKPDILKAFGAQEHDEAKGFIVALSRMGFSTYWKQAVVHRTSDPNKKDTCTADWDIGICINIIENIDTFDTLVLGSADGDFEPLVRYLRKLGKTVIVFACSPSHKLQRSADLVLEITKEQVL